MDTRQAKKLMTESEFEIYQKSRERGLNESHVKELKSLIARSRRLRDKNRDLAKRQTRRGVDGSTHPLRTLQKAELFQEVLERLETRLAKIQTAKGASEQKASKSIIGSSLYSKYRSGRAARRGLAEKARLRR